MSFLDKFALELPKVELHAHLNGSLSRETLWTLQAGKPLVKLELPTQLKEIKE